MTMSLWWGMEIDCRERESEWESMSISINLVSIKFSSKGNRSGCHSRYTSIFHIMWNKLDVMKSIYIKYIFFFYYLLYYDHNIHGWLNICWKSLKISCRLPFHHLHKNQMSIASPSLSSFYRSLLYILIYVFIAHGYSYFSYSKTSSSSSSNF